MKVSVVVPIYNVEKYIRRCIDSIQKQSLQDIEIIVVNDSTPDNSMSIVEELAKEDRRIRIFNFDKNRGPMCARETGYIAATGDYITFCDGDDYMPIDALENLYCEVLKTNADIVSGNYIYITTTGEEIRDENKLPYGNDAKGVLKSLLRKEFAQSLWGKLFRKSLLQDYKYQTYEHATNAEDGCLLYQVLPHANKVIQIGAFVYYYMQNIESSTQRRFNENAIRSICVANKTKIQTVSVYLELKEDLNKCVTNIICSLYAKGYHHNVNLRKYIHDNGLDVFVSWLYIVRYLDFRFFMKIYIRQILFKLHIK